MSDPDMRYLYRDNEQISFPCPCEVLRHPWLSDGRTAAKDFSAPEIVERLRALDGWMRGLGYARRVSLA